MLLLIELRDGPFYCTRMTTCCCSRSQAAGLTFDEEGAALTYAIVFAAGSLPWSRTGLSSRPLRRAFAPRSVLASPLKRYSQTRVTLSLQ